MNFCAASSPWDAPSASAHRPGAVHGYSSREKYAHPHCSRKIVSASRKVRLYWTAALPPKPAGHPPAAITCLLRPRSGTSPVPSPPVTSKKSCQPQFTGRKRLIRPTDCFLPLVCGARRFRRTRRSHDILHPGGIAVPRSPASLYQLSADRLDGTPHPDFPILREAFC